MEIAAFILLAAIVILLSAVVAGTRSWHRASEALVNELRNRTSADLTAGDVESLPDPVARYFRTVLPEAPPRVRAARFTQAGELRRETGGWRRFRATQHVSIDPPGFVWDARIDMAPLMTVRVRDAYVGGRGSMHGKLVGLVTVVDEHDKRELSRGALLRYLAEAAWFPTALLPSERVTWRAIDDTSADVTLTDSGVEVTARFVFNAAGEIASVSAERYREVGGEYVLTPWQGRFWSYAARQGIRIPTEGEVAWLLPESELLYWRGKIVDMEYVAL